MKERVNRFLGLALSISLLTLVAAISACAGNGDEGGKLRVVTTVSPITSIVENIGGDRIQLEGVVPEGVNSHIFEPPAFSGQASLRCGPDYSQRPFLEEPTLELAEANKKDDTPILLLGDRSVTPEQWQFDFSFP